MFLQKKIDFPEISYHFFLIQLLSATEASKTDESTRCGRAEQSNKRWLSNLIDSNPISEWESDLKPQREEQPYRAHWCQQCLRKKTNWQQMVSTWDRRNSMSETNNLDLTATFEEKLSFNGPSLSELCCHSNRLSSIWICDLVLALFFRKILELNVKNHAGK